MANLKFFRSATAPAAAELGAIWFDSASKLLKVKNATDWEVYDGGRNVTDATFEDGLLTITKASGENVTLNFKDVASASQTMKAFEALDTAVKNAQSKADTGVANAATAQSAAEAAQTTADSKIASVTGDTTVKAETVDHAVTLSLATSDKGNVKFTKDADGLSANVTIPAATVTGVAANDKVLSLTDKLVSATIGLDYGDATTEALNGKKAIKLVGKEGVVISEIDASAFIKDGMIQSVAFDTQTKHVTITFNTDAGREAIDVDLSTLVDTYKAGTGLSLANDGTFSVNTTTIATVEKAAELANAAEQAAKTHANGLKEAIDAYTVNGKRLSESPVVLDGSMIAVGGTGAHKTANLDTTVEDIYGKISDAAAGGVLSFGGQSGDITLATAGINNGDVNLTMTGKALSASIVGLGSAAFTESSAYDTKGAAAAVLGKSTDKSTEKTVYGAIALANEKATPGLVDEKITAAGTKYATAAQGTKADNALQSVSASGDDYITASAGAKAGNSQTITVSTNVQAVSSASASAKGLAEASDVKNYVDNHVSTTLAWASFE
ncbi:MAG: hypothetical protein MR405_01510 [Mollicutes bacterium]|nr:hypothetical protein [Mollicutes bacterium]